MRSVGPGRKEEVRLGGGKVERGLGGFWGGGKLDLLYNSIVSIAGF